MTNNNARHPLTVRLAAIMLLTVCALQPGVYAQNTANGAGRDSSQAPSLQTDGVVILFSSLPGGLARGEALRVTWANLNDEDPDKRVIDPLRLSVKLFDANGHTIEQREAQAVGAGKFQSFDFKRDMINLPGEAGTGRLQIRCEVEIIGATKFPDLVLNQAFAPPPPPTLEIIANTGATQSAMRGHRTTICSPSGSCWAWIIYD